MKKLLLIILTLTIVFGLGACNSAPTDTVDYATKSELEELETETILLKKELQYETKLLQEELEKDLQLLELQIQLVQERIDNLVIINGINGQVSFYENQVLKDELDLKLVTLSIQYIVVKDTFDKAKDAPDYIKDELGGYVSFEMLSIRLLEKYYGIYDDEELELEENKYNNLYDMGTQAYIRYMFDSDMSDEELIARTILLIEELRQYNFYVLSCPELVIHLYKFETSDHQFKITIPLVVLINDYFEITPDGIYTGDYEMELEVYGNNLNFAEMQTYYDDFILNETFSGYVLNYTK